MHASQPLLSRLGLTHPIIQAPMAGVSTPRLAAAVTNAGGLGSLGIGASTADDARRMILETRALTGGPFNVNVFCHAPAQRDAQREDAWLARLAPLFAELDTPPPTRLREIYTSFLESDDVLDMLLSLRPAVVSFHFGLPAHDRIAALRDAGIVTMATATTPDEARLIENAGIDAIVAQGIEAGGHRGCFDPDAIDEGLSTAVLTRLLVQRLDTPVIAAGGIADGQGIRAMLALGAVAAQLGTAFILSPESAANASYRDALKSPRAAHTRLTRVLSGRPARGIVNRFIRSVDTGSGAAPADYPVAYDAAKQLVAAAARTGDEGAFSAHWAGQAAPLARELPAALVVAELAAGLAD